ncbi:MAG: hypothetical protein R2707_03155 [Acidimicrobiales bacterium]
MNITRTRSVGTAILALFVAVSAVAAPARGGVAAPIEQTMQGFDFGQSFTAEPVESGLFDNFTNSPTDIGNPIIGYGGVRIPVDALAADGPAIARVAGLDLALTPIDGLSEEATREVYLAGLAGNVPYSDPGEVLPYFTERSGGGPWTYGDLVDPAQPLTSDDAELHAVFDRFADHLVLSGDPTGGAPRSGRPIFGFDSPTAFEGDLDGYLLVGDGDIDRTFLPDDYAQGADVVVVQQADPFLPGGDGGRAENILRLQIPEAVVLPSGQTIGGGPIYNGSFAGDIFNGANTILGIRAQADPATAEVRHETFGFSFQNGFWSEIPPFGNVAVADSVTLFELPHQVLDGGSFGFASFVQEGPQQVEGAVGSSAFPSLPGTVPVDDLATFVPRPFAIDAPALAQTIDDAFTVETPPDSTPVDESPTSDAVDSVDDAPTADDQTGAPPDTADSGDDSSVLPLLLILLGGGAIAVGSWLWVSNRSGGDPCEKLRKKMVAAKAAGDAATGAADKARADCAEARRATTAIEGKLASLKRSWPPAFEQDAGAWVEDAQGNRVTSTDLHARRQALGPVWDKYRAGELTAGEVEAEWQRADTPEFRSELRARTERKRTEATGLEADLTTARRDEQTTCAAVESAEEAATAAWRAHDAARKAYEECIGRAVADAIASAAQEAEDAASLASAAAAAAAVPAPPAVTPEPAPSRFIGSRTMEIDKAGLSGDELRRAEYLDEIFAKWRGTGDLAGVAEALHEFQAWHLATFDEPWFEWTTATGAETPTSTAGHIDDFMQTRKMACYEFVHFCAYIASDQIVRQRIGGDDGEEFLVDDYSASWNFVDEINTDTSAFDSDTAVRGEVITGSSRVDSWNNSAGYYHTGIYLGDGKVLSLGGGGLLLEDATGLVDATFHRFGYDDVQSGAYRYGSLNAPPSGR